MKGSLEDLSARARRGELDEAEQRQLRLLLASSLEAQLAHRAGCEFDAEDSVLPGDDALAARLTQRVVEQQRRAGPRRLRIGYQLAIAAALTVAAAAAGPALVERIQTTFLPPTEVTTVPAENASPPSGLTVHRDRVQEPASVAQSAAPASSSVPVEPERSEPVARRTAMGGEAKTEGSGASAPAALFAEASRARRHGRIGQAIALYQQLQRRYPGAAEARASDLALGLLHSQSSPESALTHFRRYLTNGGPLAPEALWGQAQALSALGRRDEARKTYRTLLTRYPRSAYANAARAKLETDP
jgi:hypothetical protein